MPDNDQPQVDARQLSEEEINAIRRFITATADQDEEKFAAAQREKFIEQLLRLPGDRQRRDIDDFSDPGHQSEEEIDPTDEEEHQSEELVGFGDTRKEGSWDLSNSGKKVVSTRRLGKYLSKRSYNVLLRRNPEPRGGFLKAQKIDAGFVNTFTKEAEKLDKDIESFQRGFLNCTRPLLALLKVFDSLDEKEVTHEFIHKKFAGKIKAQIKDALDIANHEAERTRVYRRKALARSAKWPKKLVDICDTIDDEDKGELFGKEFRDQFHEDAKISNT